MHLRSLSGLRTEAECAIHEMDPFLHADEPKPGRRAFSWIQGKSLSIVPDTHTYALRRAQESDQHFRGLGMFVDILEAFLGYSEQAGGRVNRERPGNRSTYILNGQSGAASEFVDMVSDGRLQAEMFKKRGMQLVGEGLGVVSQLYGGLSKMLKMISQR